MNETLLAFGRGLVKVVISLLVGTGVGLLTFGMNTWGRPEIWTSHLPPSEMFLSLGAGLLTTGGMMFWLFLLRRRAESTRDGHKAAWVPDLDS